MFCSNCGAQLPPNGICSQCGVPATNMTFNGNMQGRPVTPQQQFYNPNPMYVQYQGPQQGYGQPYVPQVNVAIKGIKDPKMVAGIGATIKDSCGSVMMVIVSLFATIAMVFSFVELFYTVRYSGYGVGDIAIPKAAVVFFVRCVPFVLFSIGAWMVTFQGYGAYYKKLYNDGACMHTSGFSTIQAGAIVGLIPASLIAIFTAFLSFMVFIVGAFDTDYYTSENYILDVMVVVMLTTIVLVVMIILLSSIINQMAKIKHAIRGRNYESISVLSSVLLFVMAAIQIVLLVFFAMEKEVLAILIEGAYAVWYALAGCAFLYIRSKVNNYILGH